MNMQLYTCVLFVISSRLTSGQPPGHLKPLGSHLPAMLNISTTDSFPSPTEFYENYVKPGKPLHIKGVLNNINIPAYHKWTDEYLIKYYGDEEVEVEVGKKEDRKDGDLIKLTLTEYLNNYKTMDAYLVQDLKEKMRKDFHLPSTLKCGGFQKSLETVVLWFSSGGTKSHLHLDSFDNINCLLDGKKDLLLIDKKHKDKIEADGYTFKGSFSNVDVESVDMYKFPKFQEVPWYEVHLNKGDCFFIPYNWYHHVYSHPGRNFAVNMWFLHLWWFNHTNCDGIEHDQTATIPIKDFPETSQIDEYRQEILAPFYDKDYVTRTNFKLQLSDFKGDLNEIFDMIDINHDNKLSWEELYSIGDEILQTEFGKSVMEQAGGGATESTNDEQGKGQLFENVDDYIQIKGLGKTLDNENIKNAVDGENIDITHKTMNADNDEVDNDTSDDKRDEL